MVFKVKKKAKWDYYKLTFDTEDDVKFDSILRKGGITDVLNYSYNWPYDFCSIIEMAKIEAKVVFESNNALNLRREQRSIDKAELDEIERKDAQKKINARNEVANSMIGDLSRLTKKRLGPNS
jgi:hypothetical protein